MNPIQQQIAARQLCLLRGIDPDDKPHYDGHNTYCYGTPMWQLVVPEIMAAYQVSEAIKLAICKNVQITTDTDWVSVRG